MAIVQCGKCGAKVKSLARKTTFTDDFWSKCEKVQAALKEKGRASGDDTDCEHLLKALGEHHAQMRARHRR